MISFDGPRLRTLALVAIVLWALLLAGVAAYVTIDDDPTAAQQAIAECRELGDRLSVSILRDDGDQTWTVVATNHGLSATGRPLSDAIDQAAEDVYPGDVAQELRDLAYDVLDDDHPMTVSTVLSGTEITTRIVPIGFGVAAFCTAIGGTTP